MFKMWNIKKFFVFFAVFQCLQHCLAKDQLWGVRLFTGDLPRAEFDGLLNQNFLTLRGKNGYSRFEIVWNLSKYPDRLRNSVDYSYIYFRDVGPLQAIILSKGKGGTWFLRRVEMEKLDNHTSIKVDGIQTIGLSPDRVRTFYVFNTSHWYNHKAEPKTFWNPAITTDRTYILKVVTSDMERAGTVGMAYIQFYNNQRQVYSDVIEIKHDDGRHVLQRGTTDKFQYTTKYIGIPDKVKMWFKSDKTPTGFDRNYRLDRIELEDIGSDRKRRVFTFTRSGWMQVDIGQTYFIKRTKIHTPRLYGVEIYTMGDECADTDAKVWMKFIGKNGKQSDYVLLDNTSKDDFQAGERDWYRVTIEDIGMLESIKFKIEDGDPWKLDKIWIKWSLQTGWKTAYFMGCQCWVYSEKTIKARYYLKVKPTGYE